MTSVMEEIAPWYRDRKVILLGGPLSQAGGIVQALLSMGAPPPFVIANQADDPPPGIAGYCLAEADMASRQTYLRDLINLMSNPPAAVQQALDAFDPEGVAVVIAQVPGGPPTMTGRIVADSDQGRSTILTTQGGIDAFWKNLNVWLLPATTIDCESSQLSAAVERHDLGYGSLVQARRRYEDVTYKVQGAVAAGQVAARLAPFFPRVRVTSIVPGLAVGVSGFVLPEGTAAFEPYEDLVLDRSGEISSHGCATYYEPSAAARSTLTWLARAAGDRLRLQYRFRGAFTVSGLLTKSLFFPLGLTLGNSLAHGFAESRAPAVSFALLHAAMAAGGPVTVSPAALEAEVNTALRENRGAALVLETPNAPGLKSRTRWVTRERGYLAAASAHERSVGCVVHTPAGQAGKLLLVAGPSFVTASGTIGGDAAAACRIAEQEWQLGIGDIREPWPVPA